jgi:hypothetical protein
MMVLYIFNLYAVRWRGLSLIPSQFEWDLRWTILYPALGFSLVSSYQCSMLTHSSIYHKHCVILVIASVIKYNTFVSPHLVYCRWVCIKRLHFWMHVCEATFLTRLLPARPYWRSMRIARQMTGDVKYWGWELVTTNVTRRRCGMMNCTRCHVTDGIYSQFLCFACNRLPSAPHSKPRRCMCHWFCNLLKASDILPARVGRS